MGVDGLPLQRKWMGGSPYRLMVAFTQTLI
jgi:hypothetical protein